MFEKFTVIDLIKTRSASVCTFTGNVVKFNIQTAQELHFPEYIQFLIEPKSKQFAIRACKEDAPNAVRFSKPEGEQKAQVKISNATVVDLVRKLMDWNAEDIGCVCTVCHERSLRLYPRRFVCRCYRLRRQVCLQPPCHRPGLRSAAERL